MLYCRKDYEFWVACQSRVLLYVVLKQRPKADQKGTHVDICREEAHKQRIESRQRTWNKAVFYVFKEQQKSQCVWSSELDRSNKGPGA